MHPKFLNLLCCPETGEPLTLDAELCDLHGMVQTGTLRTPSGRTYPIVRGVPRFVSAEHYAASFGYEWARWPRVQFEAANVGRPMEGHTTRMWERITDVPDDRVAGRLVVEFGCGPGRFLDVVRRKGGVVVGIDLSAAADAARANFADDPDVLIVQGDLLRPPFRRGAFEGGYSVGALHHTPEPETGLAALARVVQHDGWVSCCVYPKGDFYDFASVRRFRRVQQAIRPVFGYRAALAYAWLAAYVLAPLFRRLKRTPLARLARWLERNWVVALWLKDPRWRVLDVFDAITPAIASTHTPTEVARWFERAGCGAVRQTPWCATSFAGVRRSPQVATPWMLAEAA